MSTHDEVVVSLSVKSARPNQNRIAHAALDTAIANYPDQRFTLRNGVLVIREHAPPLTRLGSSGYLQRCKMPRNILIFADGTGNEGGLVPDESRTSTTLADCFYAACRRAIFGSAGIAAVVG